MSYTPLFANLQPQILATGVCSRRQFVGGVMGMAGTLAVAGVAQAGVAQAAGTTRDVMGWSQEQIIVDILNQYEDHLHFLHTVR